MTITQAARIVVGPLDPLLLLGLRKSLGELRCLLMESSEIAVPDAGNLNARVAAIVREVKGQDAMQLLKTAQIVKAGNACQLFVIGGATCPELVWRLREIGIGGVATSIHEIPQLVRVLRRHLIQWK